MLMALFSFVENGGKRSTNANFQSSTLFIPSRLSRCAGITVTNSMSKLCNKYAQCVNFTGATVTINRPGHGKLPSNMMAIELQEKKVI